MQPRVIAAHADLIFELLKLQKNLSFRQQDMKAALASVASDNAASWRLSDQEQASFADRVGKRIRTLCCHFIAAGRKKRIPRWVADIVGRRPAAATVDDDVPDFGIDGVEDEGEEEEQGESDVPDEAGAEPAKHVPRKPAAASGAEPTDFFVGWETTLQKAWRVPSDSASGTFKEFGKICGDPDARDSDPVVACWPDGFREIVPGLTMGQWRARQSSSAGSRKVKGALHEAGDFFIREKTDSNSQRLMYVISSASDRSKQRCQLYQDACGDSLGIMKMVMQRMVESDDVNPYEVRNELLARYNVNASKSSASGSGTAPAAVTPPAMTRGDATPATVPTTPPSKRPRASPKKKKLTQLRFFPDDVNGEQAGI